MSTELRVKLLGEHPDAYEAVDSIRHLIKMISKFSDAAGQRWRFTHLSLGSVEAGIAASDAFVDSEAVFSEIIRGFDDAEHRSGAPDGWSEDVTRDARRVLDGASAEGIMFRLLRDGVQVQATRATGRALRNLDEALNAELLESIGSLVGQLDSANLHHQRRASLWPDRGGKAVEVRFDASLQGQVTGHLGRRVEAIGRLFRNGFGEVKYIRLRRLEALPSSEDAPPLSGLIGLDPNFTGGMEPDEYLRKIRG